MCRRQHTGELGDAGDMIGCCLIVFDHGECAANRYFVKSRFGIIRKEAPHLSELSLL